MDLRYSPKFHLYWWKKLFAPAFRWWLTQLYLKRWITAPLRLPNLAAGLPLLPLSKTQNQKRQALCLFGAHIMGRGRMPWKVIYLHSALNQHRQMTVILTLSLSVITYHNQQNTDTHTIKKQNEIETVNSWVWHKPTNSQGMVSTKHTTACKLLPIHENHPNLCILRYIKFRSSDKSIVYKSYRCGVGATAR